MSSNSLLSSLSLWVLVLISTFCLSLVLTQEPVMNVTNSSTDELPLPCVNGVSTEGKCICNPGWAGYLCDTCIRARIKLVNDTGIIIDGSDVYKSFTQCLFYIEANSSVSAIHLRFHSFHTECQWDALNMFQGDSIFGPKIASYSGDIIEIPPMELAPQNTMSNENTHLFPNATAMPPQAVTVPYQDPKEITLSVPGSQLLLYFYSDAGAERPGFEIAYWVEYACPDNCSGNGLCENGTCACDVEYTGQFCHLPVCPNNCSGNGVCASSRRVCQCSHGYTGPDCSIDVSTPHWSRVDFAPLPENLTLATIARASHSAVLLGTNSDYMLIYGGYQFPEKEFYYRPVAQGVNSTVSMANSTSGTAGNEANSSEPVQLLRYHFQSQSWEEVFTYAGVPAMGGDGPVSNGSNGTSTEEVQLLPRAPEPRYGHTAVIYNNTMYVFGGALLSNENMTSEFWALDLTNLTWTIVPVFTIPSSPLNITTGDNTISMATSDSESTVEPLPIAVRSHTAHVVGNKMLALFGLSSGRTYILSYIQEFDFDTGMWSLPPMRGARVAGRMGHSSAYDPLSGLIYVHGGAYTVQSTLPSLLTLNPSTYSWTTLLQSTRPRFLHSSVFIGPLFVIFGGCETDADQRDCFRNDLHIYNTLCGSWEEAIFPGLPGNSSRYGHNSVVDTVDGSLLVFGGYLGALHHDVLKLVLGNCSQYGNEMDCVQSTGLCLWSNRTGECVRVGTAVEGGVVYNCEINNCLTAENCSTCNTLSNTCLWNSTLHRCKGSSSNTSVNCPQTSDLCTYFSSCTDCVNHGCSWGKYNGTAQTIACFDTSQPKDNTFLHSLCTDRSCFSHTSCGNCTTDQQCLWCPSLGQCLRSYPLTYIYSQCLGWISKQSSCRDECSLQPTCGACQNITHCGWCNDPADTGLGQCVDGGFAGPRDGGVCNEVNQQGRKDTWNFYQCPACDCNGHSTCVNGSICEQCDDNTTGDTCSRCDSGYFGMPMNGGNCSVCDCNGYNPVCDDVDGSCVCLSFGVAGTNCESCAPMYQGDSDNLCYTSLDVGFIYTFSVTEDREVEGFFSVLPREDKNLHFRLDVETNPSEVPLVLQLFVGKKSENLWLLANLTDQVELNNQNSFFDVNLEAFESNSNSTFSQLFSFANSKIRNTLNFTELLASNSENQYTSQMWDGDVTLVIYMSNLTNPSSFRLTVDQQDYYFILYFFATFVTCFSVLLLAFMVGWYVKRKLEIRALMRQQHIELQRRVARPFARVRAVIAPATPPTPDSPPTPQHPAYVAVETCHTGKAAVLSLFVRLPGNHRTGKPCSGRSGMAVASTLVKVNSSSKKDKSKNKSPRASSNEQGRHGQRGTSRSDLRLREASLLTTNT